MTSRGVGSRVLSIALLVALLLLVMPLSAFPAQTQASAVDTFWVDAVNGNDAWAGTEAAPFKTITHALNMADSADTIMVEPGTYDETNGETFPLAVYGETLKSTEGSDVTTLQGNGTFGIISAQGLADGDTISGFTFTGGGHDAGAGLNVYLNNPTSAGWPLIEDNVFDSNHSDFGGGGLVLFTNSAINTGPLVRNNSFVGNIVTASGGGMRVSGYVAATIEDNLFNGNQANSGGALEVATVDSTVTISGNVFVGNEAMVNHGGAILMSVSGGETHTIADNDVYENVANFTGGALKIYGATVNILRNNCGGNDALGGNGGFAYLDHTVAYAENNVIGGCSATVEGTTWYAVDTSLTEINDTITDGFGGAGSAAYANSATLEITNCIYWNTQLERDVEHASMIQYSCLHDALAGDVSRDNVMGGGVIYDDPQFVDLGLHDARLGLGSPCIDTAADMIAPDDDFYGTVRPQDGDGNGSALPDMGYFEKPALDLLPLQGNDRYETAVTIASETFDTAEYAVVASGQNYPDALSAAGLAGAYECPLVLTQTGSLPDVTADFLQSRGVQHVFIVGGQAAVSGDVYDALAADYDVERIAGSDRYDTAAQVAGEIANFQGPAFWGFAFIARGDSFPDALSLSPLAFTNGVPILLTAPTSLPAATADALDGLGIDDGVIAGGTGAVSSATKSVIDSIVVNNGGHGTVRWYGDNRYDTAATIATNAVMDGFATWDTVGIATGENYPDALAGGVRVGMGNGVVLLTESSSLPGPTEDALTDYADWIMYVDVFGGTSAVSGGVRADIEDALGW